MLTIQRVSIALNIVNCDSVYGIGSSVKFTFFLLWHRYGGAYDPYERPESNVGGYVMDGQAVDEYGRPIDPYGYPQQGYLNGNEDDELDFGFSGYGQR